MQIHVSSCWTRPHSSQPSTPDRPNSHCSCCSRASCGRAAQSLQRFRLTSGKHFDRLKGTSSPGIVANA